MKTVAVAAPAPSGDPLVAPMDGWFLPMDLSSSCSRATLT
jgi:hypothetical protein